MKGRIRRALLLALPVLLALGVPGPASAQEYSVKAVRYGTVEGFPLRGLIPEAGADSTLTIAMVFWLVEGPERTVLVDTGYFRESWTEEFGVTGFLRPDEAVRLAGVEPAEVTDVVVSHAHWDHMGGLELFPGATVWIQAEEYRYYTGPAWREGGRSGGIDPRDVLALVRANTQGRVRAIPGDSVEILPGLTVFTGARHTFASQYVLVEGAGEPVLLASDNCYLFRQLETGEAGATFSPEFADENRHALARMIELAGARERVVPGHDPGQFRRFSTEADGRVAVIR